MSEKKRILVVEDDLSLVEGLKFSLKKEGYEVEVVSNGLKALEVIQNKPPNLVVLDLMLPGIDGLEVCKIARQKGFKGLILILTAKSDETDKVIGLELGADDYLTKPFSLRELHARIKVLLRRATMESISPPFELLVSGDLVIDLSARKATTGNYLLNLSHREFDLLAFLVRNQGKVFSRDVLLENIWGYNWIGDVRTVDVHIRWLREKIEPNPTIPRYLITVRGYGYKFEPNQK
ncbi:MAG: Transcriptional regulatory protein WalR [candidate division WS2 bacterium]|uniref:Transcriptional regulatory protein WalR n=1 Tax=Psychracetigena formicireducens TaxID=2986056 RepID=A0A9E2BJ14_PSYF1|nr:Transcriptional regulatory protein WalR [Candidatus Psychracetigena formicireducens]